MINTKNIIGKGRVLFVFFLIFSIHIGAFLMIKENGLMMDEVYHYRQIIRFMGGDFRVDPELPMMPGYHLILAGTANLGHIKGKTYFELIPWIRFLTFGISMISIVVFYMIAKSGDKASALVKTMQYSFFPLIFPFFPLIYTDMISLLVLLIAYWAVMKRHYSLSAIIGIISILLRQNNLFWLFFLNLYIYVRENGYKLSTKRIIKHIKDTVVFILGPVVFGVFLILNGRLAMGNQTHVFLTLVHPNNIMVILFIFFLIFWPLSFFQAKDILNLIIKKKLWVMITVFFSLLGAMVFHNTHPFNQGWFFLHNWLAIYLASSYGTRTVLFIIMVLSVMTLFAIKLRERADYILYPFSIFFLWPLWFIEQRYYIIPFILFILFRRSFDRRIEYTLVIYFLIVSLYIYNGILYFKFFP